MQVEAILLREVDAPKDLEAVDWVLVTTCPVTRAAEALSVVGYYEDRYLIESVNRIWKSALHLEREPSS